jgi:hypothetical protein
MEKREPTFGYDRPNMTSAPHRALALRDVVEKYRQLAGGFGRPLALTSFGFSPQETERVFGLFDEDYHISRFFHFALEPAGEKRPERVYRINGFPQSHVALDAEIESIL